MPFIKINQLPNGIAACEGYFVRTRKEAGPNGQYKIAPGDIAEVSDAELAIHMKTGYVVECDGEAPPKAKPKAKRTRSQTEAIRETEQEILDMQR